MYIYFRKYFVFKYRIYILYLQINIFGNNLSVIHMCTPLKTFSGLKTFSEYGARRDKKKYFLSYLTFIVAPCI